MKSARAATNASKLIRQINVDTKLRNVVPTAYTVLEQDDNWNLLYERIGKGCARTIGLVLSLTDQAVKVLDRRGVTNEMRVAALWFLLFSSSMDEIDDAKDACERRLDAFDSEYQHEKLADDLTADVLADALKAVYVSYAKMCRALASKIAIILNYDRAMQLWMRFVAVIRRDEIAEIAGRLRTEKPSDDMAHILESGTGGIFNSTRIRSTWIIYSNRKRREADYREAIKKMIAGPTTAKDQMTVGTGVYVGVGDTVRFIGFEKRKWGYPWLVAVFSASNGKIKLEARFAYSRVEGFPEGEPPDDVLRLYLLNPEAEISVIKKPKRRKKRATKKS